VNCWGSQDLSFGLEGAVWSYGALCRLKRVSIFSIEWRAKELEKDRNNEVKWKPAKVAIYSSIKFLFFGGITVLY
jgi:hypothetical protein